jgi:hypothetical protein
VSRNDSQIQIRIYGWYVCPRSGEVQAIATYSLAKTPDTIFVPKSIAPGSTDDNSANVGTLFAELGESNDEVFMTFVSSRAPEVPLRRVKQGDHSNEWSIDRDFEFVSQEAGAIARIIFDISAEIGKEHAGRRKIQSFVLALCPFASGNPMILRTSQVCVEPSKKFMFEMQCSGDAKDARDLGIFSEGQAGYESWADVMRMDEVGADVVDELVAGAQGVGNAPRLARGEIEVGADDGGSGSAILRGEAFGVRRERHDYFDA